jgi:hypothetical protein
MDGKSYIWIGRHAEVYGHANNNAVIPLMLPLRIPEDFLLKRLVLASALCCVDSASKQHSSTILEMSPG